MFNIFCKKAFLIAAIFVAFFCLKSLPTFAATTSVNSEVKLRVYGYCGDGAIESPEECDDGNLIDDDNCNKHCKKNKNNDTRASSVVLPEIIASLKIIDFDYIAYDKSVDLSWKTNKKSTYEINYGRTAEMTDGKIIGSTRQFSQQINIPNLDQGATYFFKIYTQDPWGHRDETELITIRTSEAKQFIPIMNIYDLRSFYENKALKLMWKLPEDGRIVSLKIRKSTSSFPVYITDGIEVYNQMGDSFLDTDVEAGLNYYYTVFAYDNDANYSSGSFIKVFIPKDGSRIVKKQPKKPAGKKTTTKVPNVNLKDDVVGGKVDDEGPDDGGKEDDSSATSSLPAVENKNKISFKISDFEVLALNDFNLNKGQGITAFVGDSLQFRVRKSIVPEGVEVFSITIISSDDNSSDSYFLRPDRSGDYFQSYIKLPKSSGEYVLRIAASNKSGDIVWLGEEPLSLVKRGSIIDFMSKFGLGETKIFLETFVDGKKTRWLAERYNQSNPLFSPFSGQYGFYVPDGIYYLTIDKPGYYKMESSLIRVKNNIINLDFTLVKRPVLDYLFWTGITFLSLLIFGAVKKLIVDISLIRKRLK